MVTKTGILVWPKAKTSLWVKIVHTVFFEIKPETYEDPLVWTGPDLHGQMGAGRY